jgi:hypothetical protein
MACQACQGDHQSGAGEFEVIHVERDQLGAAEGAGKAQQQQRLLAGAATVEEASVDTRS